ncbi:hypothetical protein [Fructobacillus ficulneus]|uniref:Uncharacterized protein n=1 Tax=Fructobacillus ficulneus TaxID=157463 RepID=A0A0K8MJ29_9LACO|nr:hypothetical protein [Fructobacillus ficulneus]GAP00551.1 hypothetical protein FFIC_285700 [Fructobacillus ficulneus]
MSKFVGFFTKKRIIATLVLVVVIAGAAAGFSYNRLHANQNLKGTYTLTQQDSSGKDQKERLTFAKNNKVTLSVDGTSTKQAGTYKMTDAWKGTFSVTLKGDKMTGFWDDSHRSIILEDKKTKLPVVFTSEKKAKSGAQLSGSFPYAQVSASGAEVDVAFSGNDVAFVSQSSVLGSSNYAIKGSKVYITGFGALKPYQSSPSTSLAAFMKAS